ncbi:hypothetical protein BDA99DRAFT_608196 [Phascolomyces articulosus]|uniref:DH domain-containing protein n=1 Tax=Phascolomyces articulosus TaxID=60185 RepID=A0AAD5JRB5_9FUNG|nr:hypothetical protein BDA99DRAFT_608196 [Phascolomyces articulosus]
MALNASTSFLAQKAKKQEKRQSFLNRLSQISSSSNNTLSSSTSPSSQQEPKPQPLPSSSRQQQPQLSLPPPSASKSIAGRIRTTLITSVSRRRESSSNNKQPTKSKTTPIKRPNTPRSNVAAKPPSIAARPPPHPAVKPLYVAKPIPRSVVRRSPKPARKQLHDLQFQRLQQKSPQPSQEPSTKPLPSLPPKQEEQKKLPPSPSPQQSSSSQQAPAAVPVEPIRRPNSNILRDPRKRSSMYAQQATPRVSLRRPHIHTPPRPASQMAPIHYYCHDNYDPWRRCSTADILNEMNSPISRTRSSSRSSCSSLSTLDSNESNLSTRSSSVSSLPTPNEDHELPTPIVSFSAMALPLQQQQQQQQPPVHTNHLNNNKKRQRHYSSGILLNMTPIAPSPSPSLSSNELRPSRAKSVFVNRKEIKAISVWRDTMAKLSGNDEQHPPPPLSPLSSLAPNNNNKQNMVLAKFVLHEIYTTEQSYYRLLSIIQTRYMEPMTMVNNNNNNHHAITTSSAVARKASLLFFNTNDLVPLLFRHLPDLLALSERLLLGLERQLQRQQQDITRVGRLFCSVEDELSVFLKYAVHYESNIKSIRRACATNPLFLKIEQEGISKRETNRMGFADYLIAPFQRVPRYCLLIKDLMKHSTTTELPDPDLDKTLKMLTSLAVAMNHVQKIPR